MRIRTPINYIKTFRSEVTAHSSTSSCANPHINMRTYVSGRVRADAYIYNRRAERAPHLSYSGEKSSSYIYICFLYIYIYIYTSVRRARAVHARATRKRRTGRLRFNGQYNRLKTATLVLSCS